MISAHLFIVHVFSSVCSAESELSLPDNACHHYGCCRKEAKENFYSLRPNRVIIVLNYLKYHKI